MLNVFITIDTEIWCGGWNNIDEIFPDAFNKYIYGSTPKGDYALPIQLKILNDCGLTGIYFVEPLFSLRFGLEPLQEIVGLITEANQEIQLHIHPEWVDEAKMPILPDINSKRPYLFNYSYSEQSTLIEKGLDLLIQAGVNDISAFRAGSYAANKDTLKALNNNNINIDSSYNFASQVGTSDMAANQILTQPYIEEGVSIYPVTIFKDYGPNTFRPLQLTACSTNEFEYILNYASDEGWDSIVIVLHNFELLSQSKTKVDKIVLQRFVKLCQFLDKNRDRFSVCGMQDPTLFRSVEQPVPLTSSRLRTGARMVEQKMRQFL